MRPCSTLTASLVAGATLAHAFTGTSPIIAWSSQQLNSLALLNPAHPSHSSYRSSSTVTQQQPLAAEENAEDDLCSLSTLLLVSVPGLHISDFNFLPAIAVAPTGVRAALEHHKQERRVASHPYVATTRSAGFNSAEQLVKRFVHECGAVVEGENVKSLWNGVEGRTVRVVQEVGLDEWELVGREARKGRQGVVEQLDARLKADHLEPLLQSGNPYAVILTGSLPATAVDKLLALAPAAPATLAKRQYQDNYAYSAESSDDELEEKVAEAFGEASEGWEDLLKPLTTMVESAFATNQTSIFAVKKNAGLLHRYVFFTPALIFGLLISLLLLIPVIVMSSAALQSVETLAGLERGKMLGAVGGGEQQGKSG